LRAQAAAAARAAAAEALASTANSKAEALAAQLAAADSAAAARLQAAEAKLEEAKQAARQQVSARMGWAAPSACIVDSTAAALRGSSWQLGRCAPAAAEARIQEPKQVASTVAAADSAAAACQHAEVTCRCAKSH
jgi:hypothetical protein